MSPNAAIARMEATMPPATQPVASELLGALQVAPEAVIEFAAGLLGFPECRRFALVSAGRDGLFWLQSLEHATLAFLLADPFHFVPGYAVELGDADRTELAARDAADVALLAIVTLPRTRDERPTANLQGPLALNVRDLRGRQLALGEGRWGVRWGLDLETG